MVGWLIVLGILLIIAIALFMSVSVSIEYGDALRIKIKYAGIKIFSMSPEEEEKKKELKQKGKKTKAEKKAEKQAKKEVKKQAKLAEKNKKAQKSVAENTKSSDGITENSVTENTESSDGTDNPAGTESTEGSKKDKKKKKAKKTKKDFSETFNLIKMLVESAGKPMKRLFKHIKLTLYCLEVTASGDDAHKAALNYGKINWAVGSVLSFLDSTVRLNVKKVDIGVDFCSGETEFYINLKIKMRVSTAIGCALWFVVRMAKRYLGKSKNENKQAATGTTAASQKGI